MANHKIDITYYEIWLLSIVGVVWDVRKARSSSRAYRRQRVRSRVDDQPEMLTFARAGWPVK